jgi:hypothetical protein
MDYERGRADRNKSVAHEIAWGKQYSGMTERLYSLTDEVAKGLLSRGDYTVYSYADLLGAITNAIRNAQLKEIDLAIEMAKRNDSRRTLADLLARRAVIAGYAEVSQPAPATQAEDDIFTVEAPK